MASLSPLLLKHHAIQGRVNQQLTTLLGKKAKIADLSWRWLPIPALQIKDLRSENDSYSLTIPKVLLFPNWRSIFNRKFNLGKITCLSPEIIIKDLNSPTRSWPTHLPNLKISIVNGRLSLPAVTTLKSGIHTKSLSLNDLRLDINSRGQRFKLNLQAKTSFSEKVKLLARVDLSKHYYRLDLNGNNINFAHLFSKLGHNITPASSNFSTKIHAEGLGSNNWQISIGGISAPCPVYVAQKLCKINSLANLKLTKYDEDYFIKLKKLTISDPALSLSGTIVRRHSSQEKQARWEMDLNGEDIDLAAVRKIIMAKFGTNQVAKEVCAIVRGGHAKSARYTFNGPSADFKHIHKMKIWVDVDKAPIHIPGINLNLDWASGPISIINGNLAGKGLSAQIDKSRAKNGNLFLSLPKDNDDFKLAIDIDADLHNLQNVLKKIVDDKPFQNELSKFKSITGRAQGSLYLGDQLHNLETRVTVRGIDGQGKYTRVPWALKITDGNLQIEPHRVEWDHIIGVFGPHKIRRSAGKVSWGIKQNSELNINRLDADIDLAALWHQGSLWLNGKRRYLKNHMDGQISDMSGQAELRKFSLRGPPTSPSAWNFKGDLDIQKLKINAKNLPGNVEGKEVQAKLSNKSVALTGIFTAAGQSLYLNGRYRHHNLKKWHGKSTFNGVIDGKLGQWLKEQEWLPAELFPKLPFQLKDFTVTNNNSSWTDIRIQGDIIAGLNNSSGPALSLDIIHTPRISLNNLVLRDGVREGKLTYIRNRASAKTVFTWHGSIRAQALTSLLQQNFVDSGEITGSFNMLSTHKKDLSSFFGGSLKIHDLTMRPDNSPANIQTSSIKDMELTGNQHKIKITKLDINMGPDVIKGQGGVTTNKKNYQLNLNIAANNLAWHNLRQTLTTLRDKFKTGKGRAKSEPDKKTHHFLPQNLNGKISFDLGNFTYKKHQAPDDKDPTLYSWTPLLGTLTFQGNNKAKVNLNSGLICGMEMSGVWDLDGPPANSFFQISQQNSKFLFENALPCLGVKQSLIEGPFSLDAKLFGLPGDWQSGHLNLQSPHGLIRRMDLLSKIFTVINFTDLISWDKQSTSKHKGLEYNSLNIETKIKDNLMNVDKIVLKGKGVNLTGRGTIALKNRQADLTFFIAPLKMIDSVVTSIPLIGKALGGKKESILTFPVGVKGPLKDPEVTALPPSAIGRAALDFVMDTLTLPFRIFAPLIPEKGQKSTEHK